MRTGLSILSKILRRGLPVLALYALVLQAFLAGAAPAATFDPQSAPLCAEIANGSLASSHAPDKGDAHADCICLAQCQLSQMQAAHARSDDIGLLPRLSQIIVHVTSAGACASQHPLERGPGARAPPRV